MGDFLAGLNTVTISAKLQSRNVYTMMSQSCEKSSGGSCGSAIGTPSVYPHGGTSSWSPVTPLSCPQSGLFSGVTFNRVLTSHISDIGIDSWFTWDEETGDGCVSPITRPIHHQKWFYWMIKSEVKMSFEDAMSGPTGLRTRYPYEDGWRIVAVVPCGTDLDELSSLRGLQFQGQNDYKDYVADKLGEGNGGSSEDFSGDGGSSSENSQIQLHENLSSIHENGDENPDANDFVIVSLAEDAVTITEDENGVSHGSVSLTEDDGINDSDRWSISVDRVQTIVGCPALARWGWIRRKMTSDLCCFNIYMKKEDTSDNNNTGIGEGALTEENADDVVDSGNYSAAIDGGINDRSNGQRFIGANWGQLRGFDLDSQIFFDSLYTPVGTGITTRWGEDLDLTDPDTTYNGRTLGYAFVAGPGDFLSYDMTIEQIVNNLGESDTMTFVENLKYDDVGANIIHIGTASASENDTDAFNAFDWLDNTFWESTSKDAILTWNFGLYTIASTTLSVALTQASTSLSVVANPGDTSITVTSTGSFPSSGALILDETDIVTYTGTTATTFTGISASGNYAISRSHAIAIIVDESNTTSSITVGDTSSFAEEGTAKFANGDVFSYTGKTATTFTGIPTDPLDGYAILGTHGIDEVVSKEVSREGKKIKKYTIKVTSDINKAPKTWTFEGSDNGTSWTTLDTQTDITSWIASEEKVFTIDDSNTDKYSYYRLNITDTVGGGNIAITNLGMHQYDTWTVGDWVYGVAINEGIGPVTKFAGTIVRKERSINQSGQIIRYYASGLVQRLNDLGFAFEVIFENKTIREMTELVVDNIPSQVVVDVEGLDLLPDTVIPDVNWNSLTYKRALDILMDMAGYYSYYITPQRILKFVNLRFDADNDSARQITYEMPDEDETLDETKHFIIDKNLSIDTSQTKTRAQVLGDFEEIEIMERIPIITDDTNATPPYAIKITDLDTGVDSDNEIEDTYLVVLSHNKIQTRLLSDEEKAIEVSVRYNPANYSGVRVFGGWFVPRSNPYNFVTRDVYSAFYVKVFKPAQEFEVTYVYKTNTPIFADTNWIGTAYTDFGVQNIILALDRRFKKKIISGEIIRDDSEDLEKYAKQLIDPFKDWFIGGTVIFNGHRLEIELDKFLNFSGTSQDWGNINAYVKSIAYDFINLTSSTQVSNNYFIGSIPDSNIAEDIKIVQDSEEIQRILQRLRNLEIENEQF